MADQQSKAACSDACDPNCKDTKSQGCCSTGSCTKTGGAGEKKILPGRTRMSPEELEEARKREDARHKGQCSDKCDTNCKDTKSQGCCSTGTCTKTGDATNKNASS